MTSYELMVIYKSNLNKEVLDAEIQKMKTNITNSSGQVSKIEQLGRRELQAEFHGEKQGQYVQFLFNGSDPELINKINNLARITETLVKFQVHRLGDAPRKFKGNPIRLKNPITINDHDDSGDDDYVGDVV